MTTKMFRQLTLSMLAMTASIAPLSAFNVPSEDDPVIIIIQQKDLHNQEPRNPSSNPFFAEYNDILSAVMLGSNASIGDVTVTLVSTAGDWYQTVFDTSEGAILIPASGDSGHYTLTLVTQDGHTFVGEFDL